MNLFGYENIDERLKAIFDEAGNKAFKVTCLAAIAVVIIRTQILGYQDFNFEIIILCILLPGFIAHGMIIKKHGITRDTIVDEQYRNGYFARYLKDHFWTKSVSRGSIVFAIAIAHYPYNEWSWFMLVLFTVTLVIGVWLEYTMIKNRLAKEAQAGMLQEEL